MITIEKVRAYIHAHDDTHADKIEQALRLSLDAKISWLDPHASDYLRASFTPEVRARTIDRVVKRMESRMDAGHPQYFNDLRGRSTGPFFRIEAGERGVDWHFVPMTPTNKKKGRAWFHEEMNRRLKLLTLEQSLDMTMHEKIAPLTRYACDDRRTAR